MQGGMRIVAVVSCVWMLAAWPSLAQSDKKAPLQLEDKIMLGDVRGRIDHMALDLKRRRLFVAELGNNSVGVIDLIRRNLIRTITGLNRPQGVGYEPATDTLYVANGGDGSVKLFDGDDYRPTGTIALGDDADNVRIDAASRRVVVGYGNGALALIDPTLRSVVQKVALPAHPESFQLDASGLIFVNLPEAKALAVIDGKSGRPAASWAMDKAGNYAMAVDRERGQVLVAFRSPPRLTVFSMADGKAIMNIDTCGDVDDLFVDGKRQRVYLSCGAGSIDVLELDGTRYHGLAQVPTERGARTSLFVPELDRLLVAVRDGSAGPAAIWVFKPLP